MWGHMQIVSKMDAALQRPIVIEAFEFDGPTLACWRESGGGESYKGVPIRPRGDSQNVFRHRVDIPGWKDWLTSTPL